MASENNNEKITPARAPYRFASPFIFAIIIIQVLVSMAAYPFLPPMVPSHWNAAGQINGYMPKLEFLAMFPLMNIGIFALVQVLMAAGPRLGNQSMRTNRNVVNLILSGAFLFTLVTQLTAIAAALHVAIDTTLITSLGVSVLFIFIGNFLGKVRRNFWAGIRTPWTLTNETVWERTHRLGGWLFVAGGLAGIITSFIPGLRFYGILAIVLGITAITVVYSYVVYQRVVGSDQKRLSPPFDENM